MRFYNEMYCSLLLYFKSRLNTKERFAQIWEKLITLCKSTKIAVWIHRQAEEPFIYPLSNYAQWDPKNIFLPKFM